MIGRVLGIETGTADVAEFIRRLVFSTLTGRHSLEELVAYLFRSSHTVW